MKDSFAVEFLKGQRACDQGLPADPNGSVSYHRGYATQYQIDQIRDNHSDASRKGLENIK